MGQRGAAVPRSASGAAFHARARRDGVPQRGGPRSCGDPNGTGTVAR
jgi:hypothetical protein